MLGQLQSFHSRIGVTIGLIAGFASAYLGLAGNIFTAIVDLPGPASQPGVAAAMPQAAIFYTLLDRRADDADRVRISDVRNARGA